MFIIKFIKLCLFFFTIAIHTKSKKSTKNIQSSTVVNSTTIISKSDPKKVLIDFFQNTKTLKGSFFHIITKDNITSTDIAPVIWMEVKGIAQSGLFYLDCSIPSQFKWKYTNPSVKQIVRSNKSKYIQYKAGQSSYSTLDGVKVKEINNKKPYIIYQSLPVTFLFDLSVLKWINEIEILSHVENTEYIRMKIQYKEIAKKGILKDVHLAQVELVFSKKPLCLIQWCFTDQYKNKNQITLYQLVKDSEFGSKTFAID